MTKNVEITNCVKGVLTVEVTNDNIKQFTLLLNIEREPRTVIHVKRAKLFDPMDP